MLAGGPAHLGQGIEISNMVLPCMVHGLRETWKPRLVPDSPETTKSVPDYVLDASKRDRETSAR